MSAPSVRPVSSETVRLERDGALARLTLDRPPLNILDLPMLESMTGALGDIDADPSVGAVLLTGAGKAFCAGVSVADHTADRVERMIGTFHEVIDGLLALPCPVIAAVNGAALGGGCELLLACDVVFVREGAKLGQPEIKLGVFPPAAAVLLPRLVGRQRATDLVLSGRAFGAKEAVELGLAARAIPADDFDAAVERYVGDLVSLSRPVLRLAKRAVRRGADGDAGDAMRAVERLYLDELMGLADAHEGLAAFMEKRPPAWAEA